MAASFSLRTSCCCACCSEALRFEFPGALRDLVVELVAPALQGLCLLVDRVEQLVQVPGQRAQFVARRQGTHTGLRIAFFDELHGQRSCAAPARNMLRAQRTENQADKAIIPSENIRPMPPSMA
jgi:hypothetical protein